MGDQIESFLGNYKQSNISFDYINEGEEPLGTAGAIFNMIDKGLINDDHFWVINADIMTNFSFSAIQLKSNVMGHIILIPNPDHNLSGDFCLEGDRVTISGNQRYTFSGISYFSIHCFIQSKQRYFTLADLLREHIEKEMITGQLFHGDWLDVGTADRLAEAENICRARQNNEQAVKKNLITMIYTNAPPAIAPYGALKSLFGTNPICFGTPTGSKVPFILDTSISMINRGKIRVAARNNQKIPEGVALDKFGKPTTDAKMMFLFLM